MTIFQNLDKFWNGPKSIFSSKKRFFSSTHPNHLAKSCFFICYSLQWDQYKIGLLLWGVFFLGGHFWRFLPKKCPKYRFFGENFFTMFFYEHWTTIKLLYILYGNQHWWPLQPFCQKRCQFSPSQFSPLPIGLIILWKIRRRSALRALRARIW